MASCFLLIDDLYNDLNRRVVNQQSLRNSEIISDLEHFGINCQNMSDARLQWVELMNQILLAITPFHFMLRQHRQRFSRLYNEFRRNPTSHTLDILDDDIESLNPHNFYPRRDNPSRTGYRIRVTPPAINQALQDLNRRRILVNENRTTDPPSDSPVVTAATATAPDTTIQNMVDEVREQMPNASVQDRVQAVVSNLTHGGQDQIRNVFQSAVNNPGFLGMMQNMLPGMAQGMVQAMQNPGISQMMSSLVPDRSPIPEENPDLSDAPTESADDRQDVEQPRNGDVVIEDVDPEEADEVDEVDEEHFNRILTDTLRTFHAEDHTGPSSH
jgi:hypothetical protein